MKETRARFVLVEDGTLPKVKEAIKTLNWTVSVLNFGKEKCDNGTFVDDLFKDDGSGEKEIFISVGTSGQCTIFKRLTSVVLRYYFRLCIVVC
jgi:hypothetical protein